MCSLCLLPVAKNHNFDVFGGSCAKPLLPMRAKFSDQRYTFTCEISSRSVYSVVLWRRKTPIFADFCCFLTSAFSDVVNWHQSQKVEHRCRTTNLPLSNVIKIVSVLQRFHGEIGSTNSDGQTDRQTDKKTQRFWPPWRRVKSEPHQCEISPPSAQRVAPAGRKTSKSASE